MKQGLEMTGNVRHTYLTLFLFPDSLLGVLSPLTFAPYSPTDPL